jgi:protease I
MNNIINDIKNDAKEVWNNLGKSEVDNYQSAPTPERLKKGKKIAIITGDNTEDLEFFYPYYRFNEEGYDVDVITLKGGNFAGKHGIGLKNSKAINDIRPQDYELVYLPGGKAPQKLSEDEKVIEFIREFKTTGKKIAAICHGAQILAKADLIRGKKIAAWPGIKDEIEKAGATFADEALKEDGQFITARKPGDLPRHLYGVLDCLQKK